MQGIRCSSSLEELHTLAHESPDCYQNVSARMRAFHAIREQLAMDGWRRMIEEIG